MPLVALAVEDVHGRSEAAVLEVAPDLGVRACPWAPGACTPVPGPSAATTTAPSSSKVGLEWQGTTTLVPVPMAGPRSTAGSPRRRFADSQLSLRSPTASPFPLAARKHSKMVLHSPSRTRKRTQGINQRCE